MKNMTRLLGLAPLLLLAATAAHADKYSDTAALFMALGGNWPTNCTVPDWRQCAMGDPPEVIVSADAK